MSNIVSGLKGVPNTFSSWDKCMSKAYCKWPVIAAIIIASLIVFSVVWCLARCLCCGASCCCSCLRCLDCFTPSRHGRRKDSRHQDDYRPTASQGFQPIPSPMVYMVNTQPQFATFDASSGKIHDDSLPAMPSWDTAPKRHVEVAEEAPAQGHGDDVEMGRLEQQPTRGSRNGYSQVANGRQSPDRLPYHDQSTEYFGAGGLNASPYASEYTPRSFGTQQVPVRSNSYASTNYQNAPYSPAPTYATVAPELPRDRFALGQEAPIRSNYYENHNQSYSHPQSLPSSSNRSPYPISVSTRYEATDYTQPSSYSSPSQVRPPSLLQVGRKPVGGSSREI